MSEIAADSPAGKRGLPIRITWTGVLTCIQVLMLGAFTWGSWLVWSGITVAVLNLHQFVGATALLWLGGVFPAIRGLELLRASREKTEEGKFAGTRMTRYRQRAVAIVALANVLANVFCMFVVARNHIFGGVPLSSFDKWMIISGLFGLAILVVARKGDIISKAAFKFLWAVGWRTIPILVTAILPVLIALDLYVTNDPQMPFGSAIGMALIAGQACLLLLVERVDSGLVLRKYPHNPTHLARRTRAKWGLIGEGMNLTASCVLVAGISGAMMMT